MALFTKDVIQPVTTKTGNSYAGISKWEWTYIHFL